MLDCYHNSAGTQSHYMIKLLAIESPAEGSAEKSLAGCSVQSLVGCTKPYELYEALPAFSVG
jgi:hypothetical protein